MKDLIDHAKMAAEVALDCDIECDETTDFFEDTVATIGTSFCSGINRKYAKQTFNRIALRAYLEGIKC